jgi:hypothetical protein
MTTRGGGGESFLRVHWVAVPKGLRARRVNRRRRRQPQGQPTRDKQPACGLPPSLSGTVRKEEQSAVRRRRRGGIDDDHTVSYDERMMPWVAPTAVLTGGGEEEGYRPGSGGERGDSSGGGGGQRQRVAGDLRTSALDPAH